MRAIKSGKGLLRFAGLAAVFMLAVTLAISGISLTRGQTRTGDTDVQNVALAGTTAPSAGNTYKQMEWPTEAQAEVLPFGGVIPEEGVTFTYTPEGANRFSNFYAYSEGDNSDISRTAEKAEMNNQHATAKYDELFAFYRLPDILITLGAHFTFSVDITGSASYRGAARTVTDQTAILCGGISEAYPYDGAVGSTPTKISPNMQYIRVGYGLTFTGAMLGINNNCIITITDIKINITITDYEQCPISPIMSSWDGASAPSNFYNDDANHNLVGNVGGHFDAAAGDTNAIDPSTQLPNINLTSPLTRVSADSFEKKFSYVVRDHYSGIGAASLALFDLLAPYNRTTDPVNKNSAYTFTRTSGDGSLPDGIKEITVKFFEPSPINAKAFHGLQVTVTYDGLEDDGLTPIEADSLYSISCANVDGTAIRPITVAMGGLDYTAPTLPNFAFAGDYLESPYSAYSGYKWFDTSEISFTLDAERDSRDVFNASNVLLDADVIYGYVLYYKATWGGTFASIKDVTLDGSGDFGENTKKAGYNLPNYNGQGPALTMTGADGAPLASGYYRVKLKVSDKYGSNTDNYNYAEHCLETGAEDYIYFAVDLKSANCATDKFLNVVYAGGTSVDDKYDTVDAPWTNENISVNFNIGGAAGIASLEDIVYEYKLVTKGKTSLARNWASFNPQEVTGVPNSFLICNDTIKYTDVADTGAAWFSPEGFQRTYYFRATLVSGKTYEFAINVSFDNVANDIKPYSIGLQGYPEGKPYNDLLKLLVDVGYTDGVDDDLTYDELKGSPRTLYYKIGDGTYEVLDLINDNSEAYIDIFEGVNATGLTNKAVTLQLVDAAGNESEVSSYNVYINTAYLYAKFTANKSIKKYYSNTTVVPDGLLSCVLYKDKEMKYAVGSDLKVEFENVYAGKNAGVQDVIVSNVDILLAKNNSVYAATFDDENKTKYVVHALDVSNAEVFDITSFAATTHTINKARIVVGYQYTDAGALKALADDHYSFQYTANPNFNVSNQNNETFVCLDNVYHAEGVDPEWESFTWSAVLTFSSGVLYSGNIVTSQSASLDKDNIKLFNGNTLIGADGNYEVTAASGNPSENIYVKGIITPKNITLDIREDLSKIYDSTAYIDITEDDYDLVGVIGDDDVRLKEIELKNVLYKKDDVAGSNVGTYTLTFKTILSGVNSGNYRLVDNSGMPLTQVVYDDAKILKRPLSVVFPAIALLKTFDNSTRIPELSVYTGNGINTDYNKYTVSGLLSGDSVTLTLSGKYPSVNVGDYSGDKAFALDVKLDGTSKDNYALASDTVKVNGRIAQKSVYKVNLTGIYAVYKDAGNNECFYYKDEAGAIYVKAEAGYTKYLANKTNTTVDALPADCEKWLITSYVKEANGATVITNGHSFKLSRVDSYAFDYVYEGGALVINDFSADAIASFNYFAAGNSPVFVKRNSSADGFDIHIDGFSTSGNFRYFTGADDYELTEDKHIAIVDFSDVTFESKLYWEEGTSTTTKKNNGGGFSTVYTGYTVFLEAKKDLENLEGKPIITYSATPVNAGTYVASMEVRRGGNDYIVTQEFTITQVQTAIEIKDKDTRYLAKFGEDFTGSVQDAIKNVASISVVYQYSETADFSVILDEAPVATVGGVYYGSGSYFVRGYYEGSTNYTAAYTSAREIYVGPVNFKINAVSITQGTPVSDVNMDDYIINASGANYKNFASLFTVVYLQPTEDSPAGIFSTTKPTAIGNYVMQIVHIGRVDSEGYLVSDRDSYLINSTAGIISASLKIGQTKVDSSSSDRRANEVGKLEATTEYPTLPTVNAANGRLYFIAEDKTELFKQTFNNGLNDNQTLLGGTYKATTVYSTELYLRDKNTTNIVHVENQIGTVKITLKANDLGNGSKVVMFVPNADGVSYVATDLEYTNNGDGTVSFETNQLGWFVVANAYTPEKAVDNTLTIGLSAGGGAIALLVIAAIFMVIRRKRVF